MTMPSGFYSKDNKPNKKDLEEHIKTLEGKLSKLNSLLSDKVTPYHIHQEQVENLEDIKQLESSIDNKIAEIRGKDLSKGFTTKTNKQIPNKGLKIKHLLIIGIIIAVMTTVYYMDLSYEPIPNENTSEPVPKKVLPTGDDMASKCERAKVWNLEWYNNNCH
jgi:hypothetical protein